MIITKEQRNAIALLLVASDRTKVGNFDLEDEQKARTILGAMIDSSGKVGTPPEEAEWKSDLEVLDRGTRSGLIDIEIAKMWHVAYRKAQNSNLLRKQEIEQLRAENLELQVAVFGPDGIRAHQACIIADQAARISELEIEIAELKADLEQSERVIEARLEVIDQQEARIKELEEALAEYRKLGKTIAGKVPCLTLHGDCGRCSTQAREVCGALEQLAAGKIGPDAKPKEGLYGKYRISKADGSPVDPNADYFVLRLDTDPVARRAAREYSYMTMDRKLALELQKRITRYNPKMMDCINLQFFGVEKPRVWQITEERKAALKRLYGLLVIRYKYSYPDETETLRAMLTEAGQK
jgi:F0F1-type ATP synthase epsilon subunit